ncbi:OmpP1/FadL family transporter [Chryseobacterium sp. R2A-55]|uniref:OmpP1/FadL family transporter n=1 Tax=Chryseobacterium sp. R2A-55 TaxID=2744445 RepID=UPI001F35C375|nr:outer membrane protein transport protein [Chryseobacterium sp. R2A-55]
MVRKSLMILGIASAYFVNAQQVSVIRNTVEVYSNSSVNGTSKFNSMAGSMGALGGDISVLNSNPAGIGVNITSEISGTLDIQNSNNSTTSFGKSLESDINKTVLGNVGGTAAFKIEGNTPWKFVNLAVNFSTQKIEDRTRSAGNPNIVFNYLNNDGTPYTDLSFAGQYYERYGEVSKMSVGVGGNYDNRIYVGLGLNFHNAVLDQYDRASFLSSADGKTEIGDKQYTPYSETSSGFSASVGIIGKINPQFRLGAALETPTWWNMVRLYNAYSDVDNATYTEDSKLSSPLKATLSAAYVPNKNFAINVDYVLGLTKPTFKEYGAADVEANQIISENYKNLSEIRIGAEYRIDGFRLRGGYAYASSPFDNISVNSYKTDGTSGNASFANMFVGKRNTVGAGIGYDFKAFFIDAAYQNVSSEYSSPFLAGSAATETGYYTPNFIVNSPAYSVSSVKNKKNNYFITLGWKF